MKSGPDLAVDSPSKGANNNNNLPFGLLLIVAVFLALWGADSFLSEKNVHHLRDNESLVSLPIATSGKSLAGHYLAGRHAQYDGDVKKAAHYLSFASDRDGDNGGLKEQAYLALILSGDISGAVAMAKQMDDSDDKVVDKDLLLLLSAVKEGNISGAESYIATLSQVGLNAVFLPLIERWIRLESKITAKSTKILSDADLIKEAGDFIPLVQYHLALLKQAEGKREESLSLFEQLGRDAARLPYHTLQHMVLAYSNKIASLALDTLLKEQQGTTQGIFLTRLAQNRDMAHNTFLNVSTAKDGIAEVLYSLANIMESMGAREEAIAYSRLVLYLRPAHDPARLLLGNIMEDMENYKSAIEFYRDISSGTMHYYKGKIREAYSLWMLGKKDRSLRILGELAAEESEAIDALLTKGDLLRNDSRFAEAAKIYSEVIERKGDMEKYLWPVLYARGICYERSGEWGKAETDFLKALELKPEQPDVLNYLGYSWLIQGYNIERAKEMIETAIAARPQDAHIIDSMGWALYSLGEFSEALEYMEQAISLAPRDATLNDHLGDVYWRLGRFIEARFQWQRALNFEPEEPGVVKKIEDKLKNGLPEFVLPAAANNSKKDDVTAMSNDSFGGKQTTAQ